MNPTSNIDKTETIPEFLAGGGEMGQRIREFDWAKTSLGPIETWPQSLRTCMRIMLSSRQPIWIGWGKELIKFYNDPYKAIVGGKHPWALGKPASVVWKDIWKEIDPMLRQVMENDEGTYVEEQLLIMDRNGYNEETYYTFSYTPIPGDLGDTAGMICFNTDDTDRIISERQLLTLTQLGKRLTGICSNEEAIQKLIDTIYENPQDFPFALFFMHEDGRIRLANHTPLGDTRALVPSEISLDDAGEIPQLLNKAITTRQIQLHDDLRGKIGDMPGGPWELSPDKAIVLPILQVGGAPYGFLIIGLNPHRLPDEKYLGFFSLVADQLATSFSNVHALEEERKRVEALAALDAAKTTFFSNISHEFRTPLALLLGPLADSLADDALPADLRSNLDIAWRNAIRMQKLVNTLLEFSRIEAGRLEGKYTRVDIGALTTDLSSNFRSTIEKAGMQLLTDIQPVSAEVWLDVDMYEKIVLNLISNAFKYSHEGFIKISIHEDGRNVLLKVSDTGIGIPVDQHDSIFDRFHRIENTGGRSQEGTGIGLAMVKELVRLHQGTIEVASQPGQGSTFTVSIPTGMSHLPQDKLMQTAQTPLTSQTSQLSKVRSIESFIEEAAMWGIQTEDAGAKGKKYTVLLADDNADMRYYVQRLLSTHFNVRTAFDGEDAYKKITADPPDLILSDIMMPGIDGFGLLEMIRSNPDLDHLPVIFLSARAGEEARVEGLDAGADDYLVKPFSAKELLAVVDANIRISVAHRNAEQALEELVKERTSELDHSNFALRQSNEELQQFAHVASHDLKEPLRKIKIFAGRLEEDPESALSEKATLYLRKMQTALDRMMAMVEGVLSYSILNASDQTIGPVDLNDILGNIEADLELLISARSAAIRYQTLPEIEGARILLYQLFFNFISNSLKFAAPDRPPIIVIDSKINSLDNQDWLVLRISDNGIGFDQSAVERIFMTFARLHSKDKYEGTGLGLALCKRIVERHGGTINASGQLGQGSTFTVTLPVRQNRTSI